MKTYVSKMRIETRATQVILLRVCLFTCMLLVSEVAAIGKRAAQNRLTLTAAYVGLLISHHSLSLHENSSRVRAQLLIRE